MGKIIKVTADGCVSTIEVTKEFLEYEELKEITSDLRWYEMVRANTWDDLYMVVDEEGLIKGLPLNRIASAFYGYSAFATLVGSVYFMIMGTSDEGPELRTMTEDEYKKTISMINEVKEALK